MSELTTYAGGCHCGAVRFQVSLDEAELVASDCNCSICRKKGFLHLIVPPDRFALLSGDANLVTYTFNTGTAKHLFCQVCGIHAFYRPRSHPNCFDVNVRCLDGDVLSRFRIEPFDGKNWEQQVDSLKSVFPSAPMQ
ncbi:GFA family protein [Kovacikia minuta CCNUW1]|nr:GFA family protein [Kovacikia minuta CCNUW1]